MIADANGLLDSTLNPFDVKPPPSDAEVKAGLAATAAKLRPQRAMTRPSRPWMRGVWPMTLGQLAEGGPDNRGRPPRPGAGPADHAAAIVGFPDAAESEPGHLPADMKAEWIARDGSARVQVFPKDTSNDPAALSAFSDQVLASGA